MKLLLLNGPNLNMLGRRNPTLYGTDTLETLQDKIVDYAAQLGVQMLCAQSNSEGALVDILQQTDCDGVVFNAGAYSHYSYALRDCIECIGVPVAEVHMTDIYKREVFRRTDVLADVCAARFFGKGIVSYFDAVDYFAKSAQMSNRSSNNIILVGFATSGKSTVGQMLAERTGKGFVDTDDMTYALYRQMLIDTNDDGDVWNEELFRLAESQVCSELVVDNAVVACGGGTPMSSEFGKVACQGTVVWLQVSAKQVACRLGETSRPLFDNLVSEQLADFVVRRTDYYKKYADIVVDTDGKTPEQVANEICQKMQIAAK